MLPTGPDCKHGQCFDRILEYHVQEISVTLSNPKSEREKSMIIRYDYDYDHYHHLKTYKS